jgi:hypothetical protein
MSDSPMALIALNLLDRNLANGCREWVDVTGRTYASDMKIRGPDGRPMPRVANLRWQRALADYLRSGQAVIITRRNDAGISKSTFDSIRSGGIVATAGSNVIYAVQSADTRHLPVAPEGGSGLRHTSSCGSRLRLDGA